jgi:hypothetical protein
MQFRVKHTPLRVDGDDKVTAIDPSGRATLHLQQMVLASVHQHEDAPRVRQRL